MSSSKKEVSVTEQESWGSMLFQWRDYTPIPLILLALFFNGPTVLSATLGCISIAFGELFRIYSVAFIGGISRTRKGSLGGALVQEGPFAWVRNPLYVGNFFIAMGFAIFSGSFLVILLTGLLFAMQYHFIVQYEEGLLLKRFGESYLQYKYTVPPWIPASLPKCEDIPSPPVLGAALRSERRTLSAIVGILLLLIVFA